MLKHSEVIEKLQPLQKVAIVASALEDEPLEQAGVPSVGKALMQPLSEARGVSYMSAARSWDAEAIRGMTEELVAEAGANGAKLFVTPDLKVAIDPKRAGLSEDACFNGALGAEMVGAIHKAGGAAALSHLTLERGETEYLDRKEDRKAVHALVAKPFLEASAKSPCEAIFACPNRIGSNYPDTNRVLFTDALNGYFGKNMFVVGDGSTPSPDTFSLLRGRVSLGGAKLPLERAVRRYQQLVKYCDEGSVPASELEESLRDGTALSDESLDAAVDEVIEFCERTAARKIELPIRKDARRKAADASIVLLKNKNNLLPLKEGTRVAIIGEAYKTLTALSGSCEIVGQAQGYERAEERSDALIPEAVRLAGTADVVLLFLYPGDGRSLAMPANRIALLAALKKTGKPVVALVCGDRPVDMAFDTEAAATLLVPADGPFAGAALARVLTGQFNPCGKLTRTAYDYADNYFSALETEKAAGRLRIGQFIGYQRYISSQQTVRYPFGFGLSYTNFTYSKLVINGSNVTFTVRNSGRVEGSEVAQVYVSAPSQSAVRPALCLKAFRKVTLGAGESTTVTVELPDSAFATFDERTFAETVEAGVYGICVGASSLDIRLRGRRFVAGVKREPTGEIASDYFPGVAHSDVTSVRRTARVGGDTPQPPKALLIARRTARYLLPAVAVVFFLLFAMLALAYAFDYVLFFAIDETLAEWILYGLSVAILAIIPLIGAFNRKRLVRLKRFALSVCPVLLLICFVFGFLLLRSPNSQIDRIVLITSSCLAAGGVIAAIVASVIDKELLRTKSGMNRWAKYYYIPKKEQTTASEAEFEEAFRAVDAARAASADSKNESDTVTVEVPQFYDRHLTYRVLLDECKQYVSERGTTVEENTLRDWLAALSATQLIIVPKGGGADLCTAVAGYFGRDVYVDNGEQYAREEDLFTRWKQSEHTSVTTQLSVAITAARRESAFLHTVLIRHANAAALDRVLAPVLDVLTRRKTVISLPDIAEMTVPQNLRIVVEVEQDRMGQLPASVAEVAAVLTPSVGTGESAAKKSVVQSVGFERFSALLQSVRDEFPLSEATWKAVDRLDERCRTAHIGNVLWVKLERHASATFACGASESDALKYAVRAELYPWLASIWNKEICGGELDELIMELFAYKAPETGKTAPRGKKE